MSGWHYEGQEAIIYPGTTIFLYTDGLTEAENATHSQYGKQHVMSTARKALYGGSCTSETIIEFQKASLNRFVGNSEQSDDLTMLAIRYKRKD